MAELVADNCNLGDVSLTGSHNSSSFAMSSRLPAVAVAASRCQARDFRQQLDMGIRFFDLRVRPDGGCYHGPVKLECDLDDALGACTDFLADHPGEVVLVRVKDELQKRDSAQGVDNLLLKIVLERPYPLYIESRLPLVGRVRGRIVLFRDWAHGQMGLRWAGPSMRIQDEYWQEAPRSKWRVVKKHLQAARPGSEALHVNFCSATCLPHLGPLSFAEHVNERLAKSLRCCPRRFVGCVVLDFPSPDLCELVIKCNALVLNPCRPLRAPTLGCCGATSSLDDLQCGLLAACTRADALLELRAPAYSPELRRLSSAYCQLLLGRVRLELRASMVDAPIRLSSQHASKLEADAPEAAERFGASGRFRQAGGLFAQVMQSLQGSA